MATEITDSSVEGLCFYVQTNTVIGCAALDSQLTLFPVAVLTKVSFLVLPLFQLISIILHY